MQYLLTAEEFAAFVPKPDLEAMKKKRDVLVAISLTLMVSLRRISSNSVSTCFSSSSNSTRVLS